MAQPTAFTRQYNFNDFQTSSPSTPLPGVQLDNELNAAKTNLDGLNANIAKIQRDDGLLANQSVHKNAFDTDALALIGLSGYTVSGNWAASNSYAAGTLVNFNDATYLATVAHTSVSAFATDKAAGKWILLANAAISTTGASVDKFEGNGTQTAFTLSLSYSSNTDMLVFVNGALRNPGDDYNVSGTTLTFSTAPSTPSVSGNENVIIWGANVATQAALSAANTASSNASGFASAAQTAQTAAEAALDSFDDRFLGAKSSNPSLDNDGNALLVGALYWNSTSNVMLAWSGTTWIEIKPTVTEQNNINTLAGISGLSTLASNNANVTTVAGQITPTNNIGTLAGISGDITTVANNASAVSGASANATLALNYAIKINGVVPGTSDFSSKAQAVGGTGVTSVTGSSREWALGGGSSPNATTAVDSGGEFSAKGYAVGSLNRGSAGAHSAKDWATYTAGTVDGSGYSAKYWAEQAAASADNFDDTYLGAKSSDPSVDNDGDPLNSGDLYYNTSSTTMRVYSGSQWEDVATSTAGFASNGFSIAMSIAL
tara:strand:- start:325 stop:1959 length:1635 start_codon:yes stop_codon:yes gene_type:complete